MLRTAYGRAPMSTGMYAVCATSLIFASKIAVTKSRASEKDRRARRAEHGLADLFADGIESIAYDRNLDLIQLRSAGLAVGCLRCHDQPSFDSCLITEARSEPFGYIR
jgi:hypothetical protein